MKRIQVEFHFEDFEGTQWCRHWWKDYLTVDEYLEQMDKWIAAYGKNFIDNRTKAIDTNDRKYWFSSFCDDDFNRITICAKVVDERDVRENGGFVRTEWCRA